MSDADTSSQNGQGQPTAGGQELSIPKHRFDEVQARLREAQQEKEMMSRLLNQVSQQQAQAQGQAQPKKPRYTPEDLGVDPTTYQTAMKLAEAVAEEKYQPHFEQLRQFAGGLKNELEETRFLVKNPKSEGYLQAIQQFRMDHYQRTGGGWIDIESAYKIVKHDEMVRSARTADPTIQVPNPAAAPLAPQAGAQGQQVPNPAATRGVPGQGGAGNAGASSNELSLEELEARLERQFGEGFIA